MQSGETAKGWLIRGALALLILGPFAGILFAAKQNLSSGRTPPLILVTTTAPTRVSAVTVEPNPSPTATPQPIPTVPHLAQYYTLGIWESFATVAGCTVPETPAIKDSLNCSQVFQVNFGDKVEVTGPVELHPLSGVFPVRSEWFIPIRLVQGVKRFEGISGWIKATTELVPSSLTEARYLPDLQVGETVLISYPITSATDETGNTWDIKGGERAELLAEPALGEDGHYWCRVRTERGFVGTILCEFELGSKR